MYASRQLFDPQCIFEYILMCDFFTKKFEVCNFNDLNPQIASLETAEGKHSANTKPVPVECKEERTTHLLIVDVESNFLAARWTMARRTVR